MTGQIITTVGKNIMLNRTFNSPPTLTAPSQFKVGTGTTDPVVGDTDLQTAVTIAASTLKSLVTGYPVIDATNLQATSRANILSTEANGNSITEFGLFNSDGTPALFSRSTFTAINKTSSIEIAFVEKDKLS